MEIVVQQRLEDMKNDISSMLMEQKRLMQVMHRNIGRVSIQPFTRVVPREVSPLQRKIIKLASCPRDLFILWQE